MEETEIKENPSNFIERKFDKELTLDHYTLKILDDHLETIIKLEKNLIFSFKYLRTLVDRLLIDSSGKIAQYIAQNGFLSDKVLILEILNAVKKVDSNETITISVNPANLKLVKSVIPDINEILNSERKLEILCDEKITMNDFQIEYGNVIIDQNIVSKIRKILNILNFTDLPEPDLEEIFTFNNDEIVETKIRNLKFINGFELLYEIDSNIITNVLKHEHPQTIALVLNNFDKLKSKEILNKLPTELGEEVKSRMHTISRIPKAMLDEIENIIYRLFNGELYTSFDFNGGVSYLRDLYSRIDPEESEEIFIDFSKQFSTIFEKIRA